jgi:PAS domain S-box-containing protein
MPNDNDTAGDLSAPEWEGSAAGRAAAARNRHILDSAVDYAIISTGLDGRITSWNEGAHRILGWREQEMLGQHVRRIFMPEDAAAGAPEAEMDNALRLGHAPDERWHRRASGERFWASGELAPLRNGREVIGFVKILRDRTEQKRTDDDLKFLARASAELSALVDPQSTLDKLAYLAVPNFADWCAIDLLEEGGVLRRVAVAHVDPKKVALARELDQRYPADPAEEYGVWQVIRNREPVLVSDITGESLAQRAQDADHLAIIRELGLRSYIGVPLAAHGKILGAVTFVTAESGRLYTPRDLALAEDLARRAAVAIENAYLYRTLKDTDRSKDVFLATLAHELRNPLAALSNGLAILELAPNDRTRLQQATRLMSRQLGQLTRLVDDLLDISRITNGKIELKKELISVSDILADAIETCRPQIDASRHTLTVALPEAPTPMRADPTRLAQVFANLLTNAAKYTNPGGRIDVSLDAAPEAYMVRIKDNGIGIAPDMQKRIFSMFAQVSHPLERNQGGLGIGLSLVRGLVKMHGGRVEARSAGLGKGSEFMVSLPHEQNVQASAPAPAPGRADDASPLMGRAARRILVVDDNIDAATTLAEILRMLGNEVSVVHDGLSAVSAASVMRPDVVLLDIGLPGIDGYEAARRIRGTPAGRSVILIALTGWGQPQDVAQARAAGFDRHWVKPVTLAKLKELSQVR